VKKRDGDEGSQGVPGLCFLPGELIRAKGDQEGNKAIREGRAMKKEYDFSKGERGKFFRADAKLRIPVYLEPDAAAFLRKVADEQGTEVERIVNDWIRKDIDLIKSVS
jgi:hypothetical protein